MIIVLVVVLFIAVLLMAMRFMTLNQKLDNLYWDLQRAKSLEKRVIDLETSVSGLKGPKEREKERPAVETIGPAPVVESKPSTSDRSVFEQAVLTSSTMMETKRPSQSRDEWEAFIGGKLLNRIGAFALILGVGFFLKYAFDRDWISETLRVLIGAAAGIVCLAGAYRTHSKGLKIFSQGLVGAGIAILYLSIYASFNFYVLVPQWIAFVLMSVVTAVALAQAFFYGSLAVALLGWAGGFLTPIMLSTGQSNEIGLFTYIALLDVGLLATAFKRTSWLILEPLTFAATWIMYYAWYVEYYQSTDLFMTVFFVLLFGLMFYALELLRITQPEAQLSRISQIVASANAGLFYFPLYILINQDHHEWMGAVTVVVGGLYFAGILFLWNRPRVETPLKARYLLFSLAFLGLATTIQFEDFTTVIVWSLEAAVIVWCGLRWKLQYVWQFGALLFVVAIWKFGVTPVAFGYQPVQEFILFFNRRSLALFAAIVSIAASAWMMMGSKDRQEGNTLDWTTELAHFLWCALLLLLLSVETSDYFRLKSLGQRSETLEFLSFVRPMTLSVVWAVCSLPLAFLGLRKGIVPIGISALFILALSVLTSSVRGIVFEPLSFFTPLVNIRVAAMFSVFGVMVASERMIHQSTQTWQWLPRALTILRVCIAMFLLALLTAETRDFFEKQMADLAADGSSQEHFSQLELENLQQLSLSGAWLIYCVGLMMVGIWRSFREFRILAFALFGVSILKIFVYDLSFLDTLYRIFSFLGLGLILLAVSYAYQRYKDVIFGASSDATPTT